MNGPEDEDAPEAEDDARDRRQHLDERRRRPRESSRGASSVRKSAIAIEIGAASSSAPNDVTSGAEDERPGAEELLVRIPGPGV